MKLVLRDYPEDTPIAVSQDYDAQALDIEFVDLKYKTPLHLMGQVLKSKETVHFWGALTGEAEHMCGRCIVSIHEDVDEPFDLYYEIAGREEIDTTDDLREALIVDHPAQYLCKENCKGLCPQCGVNLNERSCRCKKQDEAHGPLSKLGEFWKGRKQ